MSLLIAFIILLTPVYSWAGSQQGGKSPFSTTEIVGLSKKIEKTMAKKGVRVFIIGRAGRYKKDLPQGIEYTHVAFAVYSKVKTSDGKSVPSYAYYNLYQQEDNSAKSDLVTDYTIDFLSNILEPHVGVIIPTPDLQRRLLSFIGTPEYKSLHNSHYSVMSNPNNSIFQNCTEHTLDVLNASIYKTIDKHKLKGIAQNHFEAQEIHVSSFKLLIGSLFVSGISQKDHHGRVKTATFTSIANYLKRFGLAQEVLTIKM